MNAFEKERANLEATEIVCFYPYEVIPLTGQAKTAFALYNKSAQGGPVEPKLTKFIDKFLNLKKPAFTGEMPFYDEDLNENVMVERTRDLVKWKMAQEGVPGISHPKSSKSSFYTALAEGEDYTIKVGEKITPEQPKKLTFADIKAL